MATHDASGSNVHRNIDDHGSVVAAPAGSGATHRDEPVSRDGVVGRDEARFGGIQWGSAFFGWLTATGTAVILTALFAAVGAAVASSTFWGT